jgi:hypothetical protein
MENYSDDSGLDLALLLFIFALIFLIPCAFFIPFYLELRTRRRLLDGDHLPPPVSFELQVFGQVLPLYDNLPTPLAESHGQ